jgi:hypothetical protein
MSAVGRSEATKPLPEVSVRLARLLARKQTVRLRPDLAVRFAPILAVPGACHGGRNWPFIQEPARALARRRASFRMLILVESQALNYGAN